jgi:iduronate 2-sulfatase
MGYSLRTARYRYTEWRKRQGKEVLARELYDYQADPNESVNRAGDPAHAGLLEKLARQLASVTG